MSASAPSGNFLDLEFSCEVWLTREEIALGKLVALEPGDVLPISKNPEGPVDLVVHGTVVASGELVVVDGRFGLKVTATSLQKLAQLSAAQGGPGNS